MYRVELLPGSTTHVTPGWTYVADRGFDPAKAAITPTIGRKRGIRDPGRTDLSSRQTNAIIRHLAELDRENHRDVQIQVPVRQKEPAAPRGARTKVTSNVRRILQSQKTFRNYLDDEEAAQASTPGNTTTATNPSSSSAAAAAGAGSGTVTGHRGSIHRINKSSTAATTPSSLRRSSTPASSRGDHHHRTKKQPSIPPSQPQTQPPSSRASTLPATTPVPIPETTTTGGSPAPTTDTPKPEEKEEPEPNTTTLIRSEHDTNPLLRSYLPAPPSERIVQALLAEPPLTYHAARAGAPLAPRRSPRHFCCMCGYWGKIRCKNCHARTCGLACYKVHEDSRCGAFF
ncbi:hypothetical protein BO82DRAFT_328400 [Aspergillus uvarum CBS 121591]|uniref:HIT-type domain-containing protein n=1 Tax=Aspergillus uvarum CBS 121591 TaxID=1448315 RepID=A0A319CKI3_9EURO|nr:hypothetical protein BO82DRAFT_328400 [Aspergillus uvarum CBS 121591]PYH85050.1 hypothetical protein BO82DRAFT_328400 [Aspergillus uvarum CBS 121591]